VLSVVGRGLVAIAVASCGMAQGLEAQAGLASGVARVRLVARVAPRASIDAIGPAQDSASDGLRRETSVTVRLFTNTGYRLVVLGTTLPAGADLGGEPRLWVRAANGDFAEVTPGASVTVLREARAAGHSEREVQYRIEAGTIGSAASALPVRYEIVVDPTI
jgi:hypothetical protein